MILLCGIPSEPPMAAVAAALAAIGARWTMFNQRQFAVARMSLEVNSAGIAGTLSLGETTYRLDEVRGVYTRLMDDQLLPELRDEQPGSARRQACRVFHETLWHWLDIAPGRVVNRAFAMSSNSSKPYQAQIIRSCGFDVPETLVTNDPDLVRAFQREHGRLVFKSISGVRSIVHELDADALARLEHIRWCPVQFQAYVDGVDMRVHVVGEEVYATRVSSDATDYRYAGEGRETRLEAASVSDAVAGRCVELSRRLGLPFTGIDLRLTRDGRVVCFEVNPSPAFSYYEGHTGQPIARAVARYLRDADA